MNNKTRNDLRHALRGIFIFGGISAYFYLLDNPPWYLFFIILIVGAVLPDFLIQNKKQTATKINLTKKTYKKTTSTKKGQYQKLKNPTIEQLLIATFDQLEGRDFERLVALYYKEQGYKPQIIGGAGDHEVDLILTHPKEKYKIAVQCKCWNTKNVGNDTILRLASGRKIYNCMEAWCITTSNYTKDAKEAAEKLNIKLFNGLHVHDKIGKWQKKKAKELNLK